MTEVWVIWSEWDFDHERLAFSTKEKAEDWLKKAFEYSDLEETYEEYSKQNLFGFRKIKVI